MDDGYTRWRVSSNYNIITQISLGLRIYTQCRYPVLWPRAKGDGIGPNDVFKWWTFQSGPSTFCPSFPLLWGPHPPPHFTSTIKLMIRLLLLLYTTGHTLCKDIHPGFRSFSQNSLHLFGIITKNRETNYFKTRILLIVVEQSFFPNQDSNLVTLLLYRLYFIFPRKLRPCAGGKRRIFFFFFFL